MRALITTLYYLFAFTGLCACGSETISTASDRVDAARARNDGPALWVVKDYDSTLYLFGTVHLLPDNLSWQREDMRQAFKEAGTIFFEVDTSAKSQIEATILTTSLGLRSDGLRLSDNLDNYQRNLLEAAANNGKLSIASLDGMKPWLASEYITFAAAGLAGLNPALAADEALKSRAQHSQKNILYLENSEAQIRAMADLPEFVQISMLTETMERFNALGQDMRKIAQSWALGRVDYLEDILIVPMKRQEPEIFNALLKQRNEKWALQLARFMEDSGTGFAAIGIAHLLGEYSLVELMRDQGYDVRRYYAFQGDNVITQVPLSITRIGGDGE